MSDLQTLMVTMALAAQKGWKYKFFKPDVRLLKPETPFSKPKSHWTGYVEIAESQTSLPLRKHWVEIILNVEFSVALWGDAEVRTDFVGSQGEGYCLLPEWQARIQDIVVQEDGDRIKYLRENT